MQEQGYRFMKGTIRIDNLPSIANRLSLSVQGQEGIFLTTLAPHHQERLSQLKKSPAGSTKPEVFSFITDIETTVPNNNQLWEEILELQPNLNEIRYSFQVKQ